MLKNHYGQNTVYQQFDAEEPIVERAMITNTLSAWVKKIKN